MKTPNSKHQAPIKFQAPSSKVIELDVEVLSFSGCWTLDVGAFWKEARNA